MTKLAIVEEREEDKYEHFTALRCWSCDPGSGLLLPGLDEDPKVTFISTRIKLILILEGQSSH